MISCVREVLCSTPTALVSFTPGVTGSRLAAVGTGDYGRVDATDDFCMSSTRSYIESELPG